MITFVFTVNKKTLPCYTWMNYNKLSVRSQTWWLVISEGNHPQMAASFSYFQIRELFQVSQFVSFNMTIVLLIWSGHSQRHIMNEQRLVFKRGNGQSPADWGPVRGHTWPICAFPWATHDTPFRPFPSLTCDRHDGMTLILDCPFDL